MSRETDLIKERIGAIAHRKLGLLEEHRSLTRRLADIDAEIKSAEGIVAGLRDALAAVQPKEQSQQPQESGE